MLTNDRRVNKEGEVFAEVIAEQIKEVLESVGRNFIVSHTDQAIREYDVSPLRRWQTPHTLGQATVLVLT